MMLLLLLQMYVVLTEFKLMVDPEIIQEGKGIIKIYITLNLFIFNR